MNNQLKAILSKAKLNLAILGTIVLIAILGKLIYPEITHDIFETADKLVGDLILVFVAITLGAFIPHFKLVVLGSVGAFLAAALAIQMGIFNDLTIDYLFAVLLVVLGFASIANLYRHYRDLRF